MAQTGQLLGDLVASNPDLLGEQSRAKFGDKLPFLFKVYHENIGRRISVMIEYGVDENQSLLFLKRENAGVKRWEGFVDPSTSRPSTCAATAQREA